MNTRLYTATLLVVSLLSGQVTLCAEQIDALMDQIVEAAKQRTVRFDFTHRTIGTDGPLVGQGRGVYQAPGAKVDLNIDTPNGRIETVLQTDGQHLWHIVETDDSVRRRVVEYDLATAQDREAAVDPLLALGGIGTQTFIELAGDRLRVASVTGEAPSLLVELRSADPGEGGAEFDLGRSDLFLRQMRVFGPDGEPRALLTIENIRFGSPANPNDFVYVQKEGDLTIRAAELTARERAPSRSGLEGREAPLFSLPSLEGWTVSLASLRGKHVLIDFWATWCAPCRKALPHIQKLSQERTDLVVLTISTDAPVVAQQFLNENAYTFTTLIDQNYTVSRSYGITGIPTTLILGPEGTVRKHLVGYRTEPQLRSALLEAGLPN